MTLKGLLFWIHRWLGVGMCLLFALWFASGIIMMYVEYPELTEPERLKNLPDLNLSLLKLTPTAAAASVGSDRAFAAVRLTTVFARPAYQFDSPAGVQATVFADSGELLRSVSAEQAVAAAQQSGFTTPGEQPSFDAKIELDQWTVSAGLDRHRPLHRVNINDAAGTVVYVSNNSAQIVRDTDRNERFWNWLGSTVHWIYPVQLRKNAPLWNQVIIVVSLIGIFSVVTGGIIGFMRIRVFQRYRGADLSPYQGIMKWHHIAGLLSLVFVATFIFSGLMSMGPWGIFDSATSAQAQVSRYTGGSTLRLDSLPVPQLDDVDNAIKEIRWHQINGTAYYSIIWSDGSRTVGFTDATAENQSFILLGEIGDAIPKLLPEARLTNLELVREYDNYYYTHHNRYRPLPVYRATFDDPESTWYHIDLNTGEVINRVTDASRLERWLFNGMHSLDFQVLLSNRPVWDILVILLSVIGFGFSLTSIVIGWRRLVMQ